MALFFYIFAGLMIGGSLMVISSRNPVQAVLWLIFTFCNSAGLFVIIGAEFIAMMLIVIYVGAVAVLFLFVVMMLDIKFSELKGSFGSELTFSFMIVLLLFADLVIISLLGTKIIVPTGEFKFAISPDVPNIYLIGRLLYTEFILPFQTAGLILFVAMIATIGLTMRVKGGVQVRRQNVAKQMARNKENSIYMTNETAKSGLSGLKYED